MDAHGCSSRQCYWQSTGGVCHPHYKHCPLIHECMVPEFLRCPVHSTERCLQPRAPNNPRRLSLQCSYCAACTEANPAPSQEIETLPFDTSAPAEVHVRRHHEAPHLRHPRCERQLRGVQLRSPCGVHQCCSGNNVYQTAG